MAVSEEQRRRAAEYVLRMLGEIRRDVGWLVVATGIDRQTAADFLEGKRWPQRPTRTRIENALDMPTGTLELVARGLGQDLSDEVDPVETAIRKSPLNRANQHKLVGAYYELLDAQRERGVS